MPEAASGDRPPPMRLSSLHILATMSLIIVSCQRSSEGARITEPQEGAWIWTCTVSAEGPARTELTGEGRAEHRIRQAARRLAHTRACDATGGSTQCKTSAEGWSISEASCNPTETEEEDEVFVCELKVRRAAGVGSGQAQSEGRTEEKACERARREACREAANREHCEQGADGWSVQTQVGRYRPGSH